MEKRRREMKQVLATLAMVVFLVVSLTCVSEASLVSYSFKGKLDSVTDSYNLLSGQFAAGNTFSGVFVYDTSFPESSTTQSDPTTAIYSAVKSFSVNINGYEIKRDGILNGYVQVWNNAIVGPRIVDAFTVDAGLDYTPPITIGSRTVAGADVMLFDNTHTASKNGKLMPTTVSLNDYATRSFSAIELDLNTNKAFYLNGTITDLLPTPTPIPAAAWLFGSGLAGLIGLRRKSAPVS
jgi:hypothetical protein